MTPMTSRATLRRLVSTTFAVVFAAVTLAAGAQDPDRDRDRDRAVDRSPEARPLSPQVMRNARERRLLRARRWEGDLRSLPQTAPRRFEMPEREEPEATPEVYPGTRLG